MMLGIAVLIAFGLQMIPPTMLGALPRVAAGQALIDWLITHEEQSTIAEYKINGQQLFFPNAATAVH
jgi:tungstate transport system substrate-binding protein